MKELLKSAKVIEKVLIAITLTLVAVALGPASEEDSLRQSLKELECAKNLNFEHYYAEIPLALQNNSKEISKEYLRLLSGDPNGLQLSDDFHIQVAFRAEPLSTDMKLRDLKRVLEQGPRITYYAINPNDLKVKWGDFRSVIVRNRALHWTIKAQSILIMPKDTSRLDLLPNGNRILTEIKPYGIPVNLSVITAIRNQDNVLTELPFGWESQDNNLWALPDDVNIFESQALIRRTIGNSASGLIRTEGGTQTAFHSLQRYWDIVEDSTPSQAYATLQAKEENERNAIQFAIFSVPKNLIMWCAPTFILTVMIYLIGHLLSALKEIPTMDTIDEIGWLALQNNMTAMCITTVISLIAPAIVLLCVLLKNKSPWYFVFFSEVLIVYCGITICAILKNIRRVALSGAK
jgi:hypothetical protein